MLIQAPGRLTVDSLSSGKCSLGGIQHKWGKAAHAESGSQVTTPRPSLGLRAWVWPSGTWKSLPITSPRKADPGAFPGLKLSCKMDGREARPACPCKPQTRGRRNGSGGANGHPERQGREDSETKAIRALGRSPGSGVECQAPSPGRTHITK